MPIGGLLGLGLKMSQTKLWCPYQDELLLLWLFKLPVCLLAMILTSIPYILLNHVDCHSVPSTTGEFRRLGRCSLDWATAVVGEADRQLTWVTFTYYSSGPI